jgi:uncharacterized membrane protein
VQPQHKAYGDMMRRTEDTQRRIDYCESICKLNQIKLKAPESLDEFNHIMTKLSEKELTVQANLYEVVERRMVSNETFFREQ